jgi:hypothetical protein
MNFRIGVVSPGSRVTKLKRFDRVSFPSWITTARCCRRNPRKSVLKSTETEKLIQPKYKNREGKIKDRSSRRLSGRVRWEKCRAALGVVLRERRNGRFSQIFSRSTEHRQPSFSTETNVFVPKPSSGVIGAATTSDHRENRSRSARSISALRSNAARVFEARGPIPPAAPNGRLRTV